MRWYVGFCATAMLLILGCGSDSNRLPVFPAKGQVFIDGQPAAGATVMFIPVGERHPLTGNSSAVSGPDGTFVLSTYNANDGAPAGEYKVTVYWNPDYKQDASENPPPPPPNRLGAKYGDAAKTDLRRTISAGNNELEKFDLKSSKK